MNNLRCLCCGLEFSNQSSQEELLTGWHKRCIKKFFGTKELPEICIDEDMLQRIAIESTDKGLTVPGVQKKLSLHLTNERKEKSRLMVVDYPTGYILKPQTIDYPYLPESEYLVMSMAKMVGIKVVPFALIKQNDGLAYITKRIDREISIDGKTIKRLAMEDFCQLNWRLTEDKYKGSYERCAKIVNMYSSRNMLDMTELYMRVVFSYLVGNSDMHLKNFSLIETQEYSNEYVLSEAYDLLPVNIILPSDKEQLALTLNEKTRNIKRKDFLVFAQTCGIERKVAERIIKKISSQVDDLISMCKASHLPPEMTDKLVDLITYRNSVLQGLMI